MTLPTMLPCEIEAMEAAVQSFYDHVLDIYREAPKADDAYGGYGDDKATLKYSGIPCEITPGVAHVVDVANQGQIVSTQEYTITVPLSTDVQKDDIVVITSAENLMLRVSVVFQPESFATEKRFVADEEILDDAI